MGSKMLATPSATPSSAAASLGFVIDLEDDARPALNYDLISCCLFLQH